MSNELYIQKTFLLAQKALGQTWPNPLVGAVIVKNGKVIGEGYHHKSGEDHAELDAIKNATESVEGATIYVNLEPCCHTNKRTPPCAQRLIQEKIKKVVISNLDPNPEVNGQGVKLLKDAGIEVVHGVLESTGEKINEVFFHAQRTKTPFIHLKMATTLDGKIALPSGESQWITNELSRQYVHHQRSLHQAILVGAQTVRKDDPTLNVRLDKYTGEQPKRIVITSSGNLPRGAKLFNDSLKENTLIYFKNKINFDFPLEQQIRFETIEDILKDLYSRKIINVYLEGGATLATHFLKNKLVQRVSHYISPSYLGDGKSALQDMGLELLKDRIQLKEIETKIFDNDILLTGRL